MRVTLALLAVCLASVAGKYWENLKKKLINIFRFLCLLERKLINVPALSDRLFVTYISIIVTEMNTVENYT